MHLDVGGCSFVYQHIAYGAADVVNGEKNDIFLTIENKSDRNVTLESIAGSITHPDTGKLVKNVRRGFIDEA